MFKLLENSFLNSVAIPLKEFRLAYLPLTIIYICYGLSFSLQIGQTFFMKEKMALSIEEIMMISIWSSFPFSAKILSGQILDCFKIFGSLRKSYIIVAALISALGHFFLIAEVTKIKFITDIFSPFQNLVISGVLVHIGLIIQDMIADTLCVEVVRRKDENGNNISTEIIDREIAVIQVIARIAIMGSLLLAAFIGGFLAQHYQLNDYSWYILLVPLISMSSLLMTPKENIIAKKPNIKIFSGGLIFAIFSIIIGICDFPFSQEISFVLGVLIVTSLLKDNLKILSLNEQKIIRNVCIVLFIFRLKPDYGAAGEWWMIDELGFDPQFFGILKQIGTMLGLIVGWLLTKYLITQRISMILLLLTIFAFIMELPYIAMSYGFHKFTEKYFGFGARTIALIDSSVASPLIAISMIPIGIIIAKYAPKDNKATWFALTATLLNLALTGASIITKLIAKIFVVTRGDYSNISNLMITSSLLGFILPLFAIMIFMNPFKKEI